MEFKLYSVRAFYPRLHEPHNFNASENRSAPCHYKATDAIFECSFVISSEEAKKVARAAKSAFDAAKKPEWANWTPSGLDDLFEKHTDMDGVVTEDLILKFVQKTYGEMGNASKVWMPDGKEAPERFRLTNGSICHVLLKLAAWNYVGKSGVHFRLKGVKLVTLADAPTSIDPFANDPDAPYDLDAFLNDFAGQNPPKVNADIDDKIPF